MKSAACSLKESGVDFACYRMKSEKSNNAAQRYDDVLSQHGATQHGATKYGKLVAFMDKKLVRCAGVTLLSFVVVGIYAALALNLSFLSPVGNVMKDFSMTDIYYQISWSTLQPDTSRVVTIVDMSDKFYRSEIAQSISDIESCHPKVLGIDALFEGDRDDLDANLLLMETVSSYDNIICSYVLSNYVDEKTGYADNANQHAFFKDMIENMHEGYTNMPRNLYGGIKRQVSLATRIDGKLKPSYCAEVCNEYIGHDKALPLVDKKLDINFAPKEFVVLQPSEVKKHPELIEGRVVLFGSMHEEVDMHYTPIGKIAGVKLLAYAAETILTQNEVKTLPFWAHAILTFCLVFLIRCIQERFIRWTSGHSNPFVRHFIGSSYGIGILVFLITVVLMGIFFVLYGLTNISVSLALTLAAAAFLNASQGFYTALQQSFTSKINSEKNDNNEESAYDAVHRDAELSDNLCPANDGLQDFGQH